MIKVKVIVKDLSFAECQSSVFCTIDCLNDSLID